MFLALPSIETCLVPAVDKVYSFVSVFDSDNRQDRSENFFLHDRIGRFYVDENCGGNKFFGCVRFPPDGDVRAF